MTFTEQLKLRDIKKIAKYQEKIKKLKKLIEPFMVECIDDEDYYHDSMWNAWISRWKISSISVWKQYTVDEIKTSRNWNEFWRVGKWFYHPSRFIIIE